MFTYTPSTIPHNILVVGCGGTGSRLVPLLAQFLRSIMRDLSPRGWLGTPNVVLCDFDVIEEKNLLRQNFIKADIGKNKAVVLADRYSKAYGVQLTPHVEPITGNGDIRRVFSNLPQPVDLLENTALMVIMCVDSVDARRNILSSILQISSRNHTPDNIFVIDSGNEDAFGQVNFFHPKTSHFKGSTDDNVVKVPTPIMDVAAINGIPMDANHYLHLTAGEDRGSCADLNQTLAINALVATTIMGVVQNYYYRKTMNFNSVQVSLDGGGYTTFNTLQVLRNRAFEGEANEFARAATTKGELNDSQRQFAACVRDNYQTSIPVRNYGTLINRETKRRLEEERKEKIRVEKLAKQEKIAQEMAKLAEDMLKASEETQEVAITEAVAVPPEVVVLTEVAEADQATAHAHMTFATHMMPTMGAATANAI